MNSPRIFLKLKITPEKTDSLIINDKINKVLAAEIYNVREKLMVLSVCLTSSDMIKPIPSNKEQITA